MSAALTFGPGRASLAADIARLAAVVDAVEDDTCDTMNACAADVRAAVARVREELPVAMVRCAPGRRSQDHDHASMMHLGAAVLSLAAALAILAADIGPGAERIPSVRAHVAALSELGARFVRRGSLWEALEHATLREALRAEGVQP